MNTATQTQLTQLRDALTHRLRELHAEVQTAQQAQRERTGASPHEVTDRKDDVTQRQMSDMGAVQEQRDLDEMAQVEAALQRLDARTYGNCAECGEPISLQRLRVQPSALRCAKCQTAYEHAADRVSS